MNLPSRPLGPRADHCQRVDYGPRLAWQDTVQLGSSCSTHVRRVEGLGLVLVSAHPNSSFFVTTSGHACRGRDRPSIGEVKVPASEVA